MSRIAHRFSARLGLMTCLFAALGSMGASAASAKTFSNPTAINIPGAGLTTSTIEVSGLGPTTDVNASLVGFSHTYPTDVDILLQGPLGQRLFLMSDVPNADPACGADVSGLTLNFDDAAPAPIPGNTTLASGTYKPTNLTSAAGPCNPDDDPPGLPANATTLSAFNGISPNGTWTLTAFDEIVDAPGSLGSISTGWKLDITPTNDFDLGEVKKNKKKGTALLTVDVPGPGEISLGGTGIKPQRSLGGASISKAATEAGPVTLKVKAKGKKKTKLANTGKVKVQAKVTYTPTGGTPSTETKPVKLIDK